MIKVDNFFDDTKKIVVYNQNLYLEGSLIIKSNMFENGK
jgi:hypothetical protein